jgi:type IV pilus assembly protein PilA
MVVVAIIGVLSAVVVPNFKKYQAKAKQSEAKIQLAAAYSAEQAGLANYNTYASCLSDLGYDTPAKGYYGLRTRFFGQTRVGAAGGVCTDAVSFNPTTPTVAIPAMPAMPATAYTTVTTFKIVAAGTITSVRTDHWSINDEKNLKNDQAGY